MNQQLKELNLERNKTNLLKDNHVGKKMADFIWFHKNYVDHFIQTEDYKKVLNSIPQDFNFNVVRYNSKTKETMLINAPDFDTANEPVISDFYKVSFNQDNSLKTEYTKASENNPLIYHHKWMFVTDDYSGFNVQESKERSIKWKTLLGINKEISNKIGRLQFWNEWLNFNNLEPRLPENNKSELNDCWNIYLNNTNYQSVSSAKTARKQIPVIFNLIQDNLSYFKGKKLLDIGCGKHNDLFENNINNVGISYHGCDPFNKTKEDNLYSINKCHNSNASIVTINNVLNTIPLTEKNAHINILQQAKDAISNESYVLLTVYEGEMLSAEKKLFQETGIKPNELTPVETRDGFQNRAKTEKYMPLIKEVFPHSKIINYKGKKIIVASKNPELNLDFFSQPKKSLKIKK